MEKISISEKRGIIYNEGIHQREIILYASPKSKIKRDDFALGLTIIKSNKVHEFHKHDKNQEIVIVYDGKGMATIGDDSFEIERGDLISIDYDEKHSFTNNENEDLKLLWVYSPAGLADEKVLIKD